MTELVAQYVEAANGIAIYKDSYYSVYLGKEQVDLLRKFFLAEPHYSCRLCTDYYTDTCYIDEGKPDLCSVSACGKITKKEDCQYWVQTAYIKE